MNAGRDVERLIADWLVEESPGRAPDRILEVAAQTIDRTKQRRFAAVWREPMSISMRGIAAMAAVVLLAVLAAGWIGRSTASVGTPPSPAPTSSPAATVAGVTLAQYKSARDAICVAAWPQRQALDARIGTGMTDPNTPANQRAASFAAWQEEVAFERALAYQLHALDIPDSIVTDEAVAFAQAQGILDILDQERDLLQAGKLSEAQAVDLTTNPLARASEQFESKYNLQPCP